MGMANELLCQYFADRYNRLLRKFNFVMYLAELYKPYVFFEGRFDNFNTEQLYVELSESEKEIFEFDVKRICWRDYLVDIHIPGMMKFVAD
ncbi:hypothetical protein KI387_042467 [Taxus chinensis]|uniref:Fatty acyl-CoA reductase C-terminal domain-containing protein n=1 Tax=Taxus chinensis TaxID=29808 RepID=A0AA38C432_TAXCH|nr:hypothetical protein KI387_042467 [Taxus chinensis]